MNTVALYIGGPWRKSVDVLRSGHGSGRAVRRGGEYWVLCSLVIFGLLLTRSDAVFAGRAYAAYGGVYIAASLVVVMVCRRVLPDRWDVIGAGMCLMGAAVILWGPRTV